MPEDAHEVERVSTVVVHETIDHLSSKFSNVAFEYSYTIEISNGYFERAEVR